MEERRQGSRREGERREFRRDEGRRASEDGGRRRSLGRYLLPTLLFALPLVLGGIYRWEVVEPRNQQEALAGEVGVAVRSVLSETSLPGLEFPGASESLSVSPWSERIRLPEHRRSDFAHACSRLPEALDVIREVPSLGRAGAICALLLGEHSLARDRWERVVAHGRPEQAAEAELGLALLALREGLLAPEVQDRAFSWDRAGALLERAKRDARVSPAAQKNLEALEALRALGADGLLGSEGLGEADIGED